MSNVVHQIPLEHISPDPDQPRRLIPREVALDLRAGKGTIWSVYVQQFDEESGTPHARQNRRAVQQLMEAIHTRRQSEPGSSGLVNPITITQIESGRYQIETGEVRFWACVGLAWETQTQATTCIPARLVGRCSAVHQVQENLLRNKPNAIELAYGFQKVYAELAEQEPPPEVQQAALNHAGRGRKVEWPSWDAVAAQVGVSTSLISRHLALLALEPEARQIVLEHNLPERRLRYLLQTLDPEKYNPEITRILRAATADCPIWSADQIRVEVDRVLGHTDQQLVLARVAQAVRQLSGLAKLEWVNPAAIQRYALYLDDPASSRDFNMLIDEAREALPILSALASLRRVNPQTYGFDPTDTESGGHHAE